MTHVLDTFLNLFVFVYIGLLIWLYVKESPPGAGRDPDDGGPKP